MFDVTVANNTTNKVTMNSVSGILAKSTPNSKIVRFHMNSQMAKRFFDESGPHYVNDYNRIPVIVLQVMLCGGDEFLVEFLDDVEDK